MEGNRKFVTEHWNAEFLLCPPELELGKYNAVESSKAVKALQVF